MGNGLCTLYSHDGLMAGETCSFGQQENSELISKMGSELNLQLWCAQSVDLPFATVPSI